jgi:hypothetical protein
MARFDPNGESDKRIRQRIDRISILADAKCYNPEDEEVEPDPELKPASESTLEIPGTPAKVEILRGRYDRQEELWHSEDFTLWDNAYGSRKQNENHR